MTERRTGFPRRKRRFLVDFVLQGSSCSGFSHDVSASGIFIQAARLPDPGTNLTLTMHVAGSTRLTLRCKVVRTHRVPGGLARVVASGFAVCITQAPEEYYQLLTTL